VQVALLPQEKHLGSVAAVEAHHGRGIDEGKRSRGWDRTKQNIAKAHFAEALAYVPLRNTVPVQHLRGPSYIYAILMDERIRRHDW
jgi:hypothetical protein